MKAVGIYLSVYDSMENLDTTIVELLNRCYELEKEQDIIILDSYNNRDGKCSERARLEDDLKKNILGTVITNDPTLDEILTEFILINY